jgi:hypothetical protein
MRRVIFLSVACLALPCFSNNKENGKDFRGKKKLLNFLVSFLSSSYFVRTSAGSESFG